MILTLFSVATCVNDNTIPSYMQKWLEDLRMKQKKEHRSLLENDREDGNEDGGKGSEDKSSSSEDEPPPKRMKMSRKSVDAQIAQVGNDLLASLDSSSRITRSSSHLSCSSRASSAASTRSSMISIPSSPSSST